MIWCSFSFFDNISLSAENKAIRSDFILPKESVFLNRPEFINQIGHKFKQNGIQTVALVGQGGAGKTTIARQYARQYKNNSVWEINAETPESLRISFDRIAQNLISNKTDEDILKIVQDTRYIEERDAKIVQFVKERLKKKSNWLLIFDNVNIFKIIQNHFPYDSETWGQGSIILTTRNSNIGINNNVDHVIKIGELSKEQKFVLFTKIMSGGNLSSFTGDIKEIGSFLHKYINTLVDNNNIMGMKQIIKHLEAFLYYKSYLNETLKADLISKIGLINVYLGNYEKAKLLLQDGFSLARNIYGNNHIKTILVKKSLGQAYQKLGEFELAKELFESILTTIFTHDNKNKQKLAEIYCLLGITYKSLGNYEKAKLYLEKALILSKLEIAIAEVLIHLGDLYKRLGDYKKSIHSLERALKLNIKHYGKDSIYTTFVFTNLGITYGKIGQYANALDNLEKGLGGLTRFYGRQHKETAQALMYIGNIYRRQGLYRKALSYLKEGTDINQAIYGINHLETAWSFFHLGNIYRLTGNLLKARELEENGLNTYKRIYGEDHINTAWAYVTIGYLYKDLQEYKKAQTFLERSLMINNKHYGENHIENVLILRALGEINIAHGNLIKAEKLIQATLKIESKEKSPERCISLEYLANIYINKSQTALTNSHFSEAEKFKYKALNILKIALQVATLNFPEESIYIKTIKLKIYQLRPISTFF